MSARPAGSQRSGDCEQAAPSGRAGGAEDAAAERVGPLTVKRLVKEDGRALILYSRVRP